MPSCAQEGGCPVLHSQRLESSFPDRLDRRSKQPTPAAPGIVQTAEGLKPSCPRPEAAGQFMPDRRQAARSQISTCIVQTERSPVQNCPAPAEKIQCGLNQMQTLQTPFCQDSA